MRGRGTAPVLGLVLLIGFVVAGSLAVFAVGVTVVDSSQSDVEASQVERSMVTAADESDELATGERSSGTWSFEGAGANTPRVEDDAGRINITQYVDGSPEQIILEDTSMGALTYQYDGTTYAYQSGAVWRLDEGAEPRLVRSPKLHYEGRTLTFPFVNVTGDVTAGTSSGSMHVSETMDVYPNAPTHFNPLRDGTIVIEVESEYCEGWESYFDQRTDGALIESCEETDETVKDEVMVELVVPFEFPGTENSIITEEFNAKGNPDYDEDELDVGTQNIPSADRLVYSMREDCDGDYPDKMTGTVDEPRLHCVDRMNPSNVEFDTTDGDIDVYVDDRADLDEMELRIEGDNDVTIFLNGSADLRAADLNCHEEDDECKSDPSQLRWFIVSGELFGADEASGTPSEIGAFIYGHEAEVELRGGVHFEGTIVSNVTTIQGGTGSASISHHPNMEDMDIEYQIGGRSIYYLHVTETEIEFTDG